VKVRIAVHGVEEDVEVDELHEPRFTS